MAIIYEHWRPDTNECFYVGASKHNDDRRAKDFSSRNDNYKLVLAELNKMGLRPTYVVVWKDIPEDSIDTYEKIRIAYRRSVCLSGIANKSNGGRLYSHTWSDEEKAAASCRMKVICNTPSHKMMKSVVGRRTQNLPEVKNRHKAVNEKPEVKKKRSESQRRPETALAKSLANKAAHARPDVKDRHREGCRRGQNSSSAKEKRLAGKDAAAAKRKESLARTNALPETKHRRSQAARNTNAREDVKLKKSLKLRGEGNHSAILSEENVVEILKSSLSSRLLGQVYGVSIHTVCDIRNGRTWKHIPRNR